MIERRWNRCGGICRIIWKAMCDGRRRVERRGVGEWSFEWRAFCGEESLRILRRAIFFWLGVDGAEVGRGEPRLYEVERPRGKTGASFGVLSGVWTGVCN